MLIISAFSLIKKVHPFEAIPYYTPSVDRILCHFFTILESRSSRYFSVKNKKIRIINIVSNGHLKYFLNLDKYLRSKWGGEGIHIFRLLVNMTHPRVCSLLPSNSANLPLQLLLNIFQIKSNVYVRNKRTPKRNNILCSIFIIAVIITWNNNIHYYYYIASYMQTFPIIRSVMRCYKIDIIAYFSGLKIQWITISNSISLS